MLHYYTSKKPYTRQVFLQTLIYLSQTRKALYISEMIDLLVNYEHFDRTIVEQEMDEFLRVFDFVYTISNGQLMSQNFQFVKCVNDLIKLVNMRRA